MSKKCNTPKAESRLSIDYPKKLNGPELYNLVLDEEQQKFRDLIWSDDYDIIFCDSKAGTGKTLVATVTANLMVEYGRYDGIVYIVSPTQEERIGYLPGNAEDKILPYINPIKDALIAININPDTAIAQASIQNQKEGTAYIDCVSHLYLRGNNFNRKIVIIDESQNMYLDEMKKTLTRVNQDCKTIVIGHSGQCDLYKHPERSGFVLYRKWFESEPRTATISLNINHRGWVASHADEIDFNKVYKEFDMKDQIEEANMRMAFVPASVD